jgi:hypothetical protein|nr:hypothetical protein [uncultured Prevotella sp.]DAV55024.1 MAG TPA: hypothetical protein [Caudoviricetes sp.]
MKVAEVKTLEQLVEFINERDEWSNEVSDIIESNGWQDLSGDEFDVCQDGNQKVSINENGKAEILIV